MNRVNNEVSTSYPVSPEKSSQVRLGSNVSFDGRLAKDWRSERVIVGKERLSSSSQSSGETYNHEQTFEELRTLVQAIDAGITDAWQLTDLIFGARHPSLVGVPLTNKHQELLDEWNAISATLVHPTLNEIGELLGTNITGKGDDVTQSATASASTTELFGKLSGNSTSRFDDTIRQAVEWCPGLSPVMLKSLLAQESNFNTTVINKYGYAGIAQFGRTSAREVGLHVGIAGSTSDERLNPYKAIPAAARLLNLKAGRLNEIAFARYGQPQGIEFWKFVLAAYNGGEGTVSLAMGHAYRTGLTIARAKGLVAQDAVSFARSYASRWDNLKAGGAESPLGLAAARYFPSLAAMKYHEIGNYPTAIVARALNSNS